MHFVDVFKADPEFLENEERYKSIKEDILGSSDEESGKIYSDEDEEDDEEAGQGEEQEGDMKIIDETQTSLPSIRQTYILNDNVQVRDKKRKLFE